MRCAGSIQGSAMSTSAPVLASLLLLAALVAEGTVILHNTGTTATGSGTANWDNVIHEHNGVVSEVTNIVYKPGGSAIKAEQTYDPSYDGRYHSEVVKNGVYSRGNEGYYGFAFRLQSDWQSSPAQNYNLAQFIRPFPENTCHDYIPTTMVWVNGNQLATRIKSGPVQCGTSPGTELKNLATVTPGVWHKVVIHALWKSDSTGFFEFYYDGALLKKLTNVATTLADNRAFEFRVGLYANSWYDDNENRGTQNFRQVWFDQIGAGTTLAEADPDQW